MSRKSEIFESVLTSAYDNNAFVGFVQELLNNVEVVAPNAYKKYINNFSYYDRWILPYRELYRK